MLNKAKSPYLEPVLPIQPSQLTDQEWVEVYDIVEKCIDVKNTFSNDLSKLLGESGANQFWQLAAIRTSLCIRYCHQYAPALIPSIALLSMFKDIGVVRIQEYSINKRIIDGYLKLFHEDIFQFQLNAYESNFGIFYRGIESGIICEQMAFDESFMDDVAKCTCRNIEPYADHYSQRIFICRQASLVAALVIHFSYKESIPSSEALQALLDISNNMHWKNLYKEGKLYCQSMFDTIAGEGIDRLAIDKTIRFLFEKPT